MTIFGEPLDNEIRRTNDDVDKVMGRYQDPNDLILRRPRAPEQRQPNTGMTDFEIVSRVELVRHWEKRAKRQRLLANFEYAMIVAVCVMVITIALVVFGPK